MHILTTFVGMLLKIDIYVLMFPNSTTLLNKYYVRLEHYLKLNAMIFSSVYTCILIQAGWFTSLVPLLHLIVICTQAR